MSTAQQVFNTCVDNHVRFIHFVYADYSSMIRGKGVHTTQLERYIRTGLGQGVSGMAHTAFDRLASVPSLGPVGSIRLMPELSTFTLLPYPRHFALLVCDLCSADLTPWELSPRNVLSKVLDKSKRFGVEFKIGTEHEFYLVDRSARAEDHHLQDDQIAFDTLTFGELEAFVEDVERILTDSGVVIDQFSREYGHGQFELSIAPVSPLRAADNSILVRTIVRSVANKYHLRATFAPKPFPSQASCGLHTHISMWGIDEDSSGQNLLFDREGSDQFSTLGYSAIAGVLAHLPGLLALTCPSTNSYDRLQPSSYTSAYVCHGVENREAAVRITSNESDFATDSANFEIKPVDHTANPYLALGGIIAACLDGMARRSVPTTQMRIDPHLLTEEQRNLAGIVRLPTSLDEALSAFTADDLLQDTLGSDLCEAYLSIKQLESISTANISVVERCALYSRRF